MYKPKAPYLSNSSRILWGFDHTVTVGALPVAMFANGHVFFNQKLYEVRAPNLHLIQCIDVGLVRNACLLSVSLAVLIAD